jgi:hypothetical protein
MMYTYEPLAGEDISDAAKQMVELWNARKEPIVAKFNDIELRVDSDVSPESIVEYYHKEMDRLHQEYVNSPKYAQDRREHEESRRRQQLTLNGALWVSPEKLTIGDEEAYRLDVEANTSAMGRAIIEFAERWARLMEGKMNNGSTLAECADEASSLADTEGITGAMYGYAVVFLAHCWIHGEDLRRWYQQTNPQTTE